MKLPSYELNRGTKIPSLGFGTWQLTGLTAYEAVQTALKTGYRHVDTADVYGNHQEVGQALTDSSVKREDIFLTSKLWHSDLRADDAQRTIERVLKELQTDYLDLYLIHWPNQQVPINETLTAMAKMQEQGLVKEIGVSNFTVHHLEDALATEIPFSVNQVEFHPSLNQTALKDYCDQHDIVVTAYSPLAQGADLQLKPVKELAKKHKRSTAQVVLNWLLQKEIVAIPRSASKKHIEDNWEARSWKLTATEVKMLDDLNLDNRLIAPAINEFKY